MTRRLWTEDLSERSLDGLVDLLEGYYRCRSAGGQGRSSHADQGSGSGYSPLGYLEYLNKLSFAYATLPLRVLSQAYGRGPQGADKSYGAKVEGSLCVEPRSLALSVAGEQDLLCRFDVRSNLAESIEISFGGFKDTRNGTVDDIPISARDDSGDWTDLVEDQLELQLEARECRTITMKLGPFGKRSPARLTGKLRVIAESGQVECVKVELTYRTR